MKRITQEELQTNPKILEKTYTNIYKEAITKYDSIKLYTFKSMSNNIKEYTIFFNRWKKSNQSVIRLLKNIEDKEFDGYQMINQLETINNRMEQSKFLIYMIPSNLVVTIITVFDQFLSNLLNYFFIYKDGQINIIDTCLKYSDLNDCDNINDIQDCYIDKYLDSFFRKSHEEQLKTLDSILSTTLKKDMPNYKDFVFLCELRNIIVHNDGKPNKFFMNKIDVDEFIEKGFDLQLNSQLSFTPDNIFYLIEIIQITTTFIFAMLSHKYFKKDDIMMSSIEGVINDNIVDKLKKKPTLSVKLLDTVLLNNFSHTSDYAYLYKINLAIAYKKLNNKTKVNEILNSLDWTNCNDKFIYAKYILLEDKNNIIKFMRKYTDNDWKLYYQNWPLFDELRNKDYFKEEYRLIFGEEFIYSPVDLTITPKDIKKVENKINKQLKKEKR